MDSDEQVAEWLARPMWPWPLAFAYTQSEVRDEALAATVEILTSYPAMDGWERFAATGAISRCYGVATGEADPTIDFKRLRAFEKPLRDLIDSGAVQSWGRLEPDGGLVEIKKTDWVGFEIDAEVTADLVRAGWRERSSSLSAVLGEIKRNVSFYDVHLPRDEVLATLGPPKVPPFSFLPAIAKGELRLVEEAISLALSGSPCQDADLCIDLATGETVVTPPKGVTTIEEWQAWTKNRVVASLALTRALQRSDLRALVQSQAGALCRIDRAYWFQANVGTETTLKDAGGRVTAAFAEQPVLIDMDEFEAWRAVASSAVLAVAAPCPASPSREAIEAADHWAKRVPTLQQRLLMKFFAEAEKVGALSGARSLTALRQSYVAWCVTAKAKDKDAPAAFAREAFERWLQRYLDGWRGPNKEHRGWHIPSR